MSLFLNSMSAGQAFEWELFAEQNPSFEEKVLTQLAYIAMVFAGAFIKKKDGSGWSLYDFMPWEKQDKKETGILEGIKNLLHLKGDKKAKGWAQKKEKVKKVRGTDGKWYNYALEQFAIRTKAPKRITRTQKD